MICDKCKKEIESEWVKVGGGKYRLLLRCGCEIQDTGAEAKGSSFHPESPVAYFKDEKTGALLPVGKRGSVLSNDPYYKIGDYRGWKRAGKSTRGYEREIHLDEKGGVLEEKKIK